MGAHKMIRTRHGSHPPADRFHPQHLGYCPCMWSLSGVRSMARAIANDEPDIAWREFMERTQRDAMNE